MFLLIIFILFVSCSYLVYNILVEGPHLDYANLHYEPRNLLFSSGGGNTDPDDLTNGYNTSPELSASLDGLEPDQITEKMNESHTNEADGNITGEHNTSGNRYAKSSAASDYTVPNCIHCLHTESLGRRGAEEFVHSTCGHVDNNTVSCHFCVKKDNP